MERASVLDVIDVRPVESHGDKRRFIEYPYRLYRGHQYWVPPLLVSEWESFNPAKNPFYEHAQVDLFLAWEGTKVVGRIAAIEDKSYNEFHGEPVALFGHFEAESAEATAALLAWVEEWARARGLSIVRGPTKAASNDMAGILVEGFDDPPTILMPYNDPEYLRYLEGAGYVKAQDTFAWRMHASGGLPDRVARIAERVKRNLGVRVRPADFKQVDSEIQIIRDIYNRAWEKNWGFVPWTDHEIQHMANELKMVADRDVTLIAEVQGEPAAFSLMIPDINQLLRGTGGRLFPLGLPKLLLGKAKRSRLAVMGIIPEYRGRGLDAVLYAESFWRGIRKYSSGEFGWTLESNTGITDAMKALGAEPYKRYRVLEKRLAG
jgi:hypothetical protein